MIWFKFVPISTNFFLGITGTYRYFKSLKINEIRSCTDQRLSLMQSGQIVCNSFTGEQWPLAAPSTRVADPPGRPTWITVHLQKMSYKWRPVKNIWTKMRNAHAKQVPEGHMNEIQETLTLVCCRIANHTCANFQRYFASWSLDIRIHW